MPTKRKKKVEKLQLKATISRTYSEGAKINIGNYQSRDFFASATRMMEVPALMPFEDKETISQLLLGIVKSEVKAALQAETETASGTSPMAEGAPVEAAPSVPDAFSGEHARMYPGKKFIPREDAEDPDLALD